MSVNKAILIGNAGRDPEIRYLPSGQAVANISLATTSKRKDQQTGQTIEDTQWHRITFYDRLAEIAGEYVYKGIKIYVEGRIKYGKYTDQAGVEKNTVEIVATSMQLLGAPRGQDDQGGGDQQQQRQQPQQRQQQPRQGNQQQGGYQQGNRPAPRTAPPPRQQPQRQAPAPQSSGFDDMDDSDIPF